MNIVREFAHLPLADRLRESVGVFGYLTVRLPLGRPTAQSAAPASGASDAG